MFCSLHPPFICFVSSNDELTAKAITYCLHRNIRFRIFKSYSEAMKEIPKLKGVNAYVIDVELDQAETEGASVHEFMQWLGNQRTTHSPLTVFLKRTLPRHFRRRSNGILLKKPLPMEVIAQLVQQQTHSLCDEVKNIGFEFDIATHSITRDNKRVTLSSTEVYVLCLLLEHADRPISKEYLVKRVLQIPYNTQSDTLIQTYIWRLRKRLAVIMGEKEVITTHLKKGYQLNTQT